MAKVQVMISCVVTKTIEIDVPDIDNNDDIEHQALYETDGNFDGIDFDKFEVSDFEVVEVCVA